MVSRSVQSQNKGKRRISLDRPQNHWINVAITSIENGAFQRLEEGKLPLEVFYRQFGEELSRVEDNNAAYRRYCAKMKIR